MQEAADASWPASVTTKPATSVLLMNPDAPYSFPTNVIKYSMSNRFAPPGTIITHCVYHRLPTANNLISPGMLYSTGNVSDSSNAQDILATVEPKAKKADVSTWLDQKNWQNQTQ
ncbi:hypothetical protein EON80_01935 [bacterium]|nr:MAG: hypothetical protein EON80_01935 [bacterium]